MMRIISAASGNFYGNHPFCENFFQNAQIKVDTAAIYDKIKTVFQKAKLCWEA